VIYGPYLGVVDKVVDGDTIYTRLDVGFDLTVYARCRVFGINAPELSTDAGKEARSFAAGLLPAGSGVRVLSHGWDKYGGRIDATLSFGDAFERDFASVMLEAGQAVPYP